MFDRFGIPADVLDSAEAGIPPLLTTGRIPLGSTCGSLSAMSWSCQGSAEVAFIADLAFIAEGLAAVLSCTASKKKETEDSILERALYLSGAGLS